MVRVASMGGRGRSQRQDQGPWGGYWTPPMVLPDKPKSMGEVPSQKGGGSSKCPRYDPEWPVAVRAEKGYCVCGCRLRPWEELSAADLELGGPCSEEQRDHGSGAVPFCRVHGVRTSCVPMSAPTTWACPTSPRSARAAGASEPASLGCRTLNCVRMASACAVVTRCVGDACSRIRSRISEVHNARGANDGRAGAGVSRRTAL